ncbi:uncharacterized protein [Lolium perenne]|uniref:uncharacterized protein n=1 Tax=Lolium perenne TaxID=4522 RepID=UPI003A9A4D50
MALEASGVETKALLDQILKRLDDGAALTSKRYDEQVAFNATVAHDLQVMRKQLDLTQADVDEARQVVSTVVASAAPPAPTVDHRAAAAAFVASGLGVPGYPRLANDGAPLLPPTQEAPLMRPQPVRQIVEQRPQRENEGDNGFVKPPKHDFPRFDGMLPNLWLDRCEAYFDMYRVRPQNWVTTAAMYVDGHAALWLQAYRQQYPQVSWARFSQAVVKEFGPNEFEDQMHKLLQLRQTGSVTEYRVQFEVYMYHLLALDPSLSTKFFVTQFVLGLKDELRAAVRIQAPTSITRATVFARIQEEELEAVRPRHRPPPAGRPPPAAAPVPPRPRLAPDEYARERQLRDFRRANNQCFKCGEPYTRGHQCKRQGAQLLTIQVGEFGELLDDAAVEALEFLDEPVDPPAPAMCCMLSTHALSSSDTPVSAFRLPVRVGNKTMLLLLDSAPVAVKVANGQYIASDTMVPALEWKCQGAVFKTDLRVLALGAYDGVLGKDWLDSFSPMTCHWNDNKITFDHEGKTVVLQGLLPVQISSAEQLDFETLQQLHADNEIWSMAVLENWAEIAADSETLPSQIQAILTDFNDVFAEPEGLPPHRQYDHAVTLEEGASPPNVKPYRYSPMQKDEIERQVQEMLRTGVITHSMSPYAAPVLLVKKKDGSWRFCIDFRRQNLITIKNKFPLPIVDELLDELAGATFFSKLDLRAGYHQIRMREEDEEKTAFKTHHGHFHFSVMPFGLTNAPATFQCLMNQIFGEYTRKFVIVFLDDILVYSSSLQEHEQHLRLVFELLRKNQLYAKLSKCSFSQHQIEYLGHVISAAGVATDSSKTQAMKDWPVPISATELRGFLGLTGYYRKFVARYGIIAKPLTQLLTKKGFQWSEQAQQAFDQLKHAMVNTPVLALPNFDRPFSIETDACDTGIGAVLVQDAHPIAYFSKALGVKNQQLSTYEKEFLAVMMAVDKWRAYLQRGPFTIVTDHKSLCNLEDQQLETDLQRRAMSKLVGMQFKFQYKRGADNGAADALSRVGHLLTANTMSICQPKWMQEVANSYETDSEAQQLLTRLAVISPDEEGDKPGRGGLCLASGSHSSQW